MVATAVYTVWLNTAADVYKGTFTSNTATDFYKDTVTSLLVSWFRSDG